MLKRIKDLFDITSVYIQYDDGGVTYTLVDPDESLLVVGEVEEPHRGAVPVRRKRAHTAHGLPVPGRLALRRL